MQTAAFWLRAPFENPDDGVKVTYSIFGRAIGSCLSQDNGLRAAYLPDGVPIQIAEAVVTEANKCRPSDVPYAILVAPDSESDSIDNTVSRVWPPQNAIKYRQGNRLVVAIGRHPDIHSISVAFAELLGLSFPESASGAVSVDKLAEKLLELVLQEVGSSVGDFFDNERTVAKLAACLVLLRDIYQETRSGEVAWNAQWFAHVEAGVNRLANFLAEKAAEDGSLPLDDLLEKYTTAAFSLPQIERLEPGLGRKMVDASGTWWSDTASVLETVQKLQFHPDTEGESHPLDSLSWSEFDNDVALGGGTFIALLNETLPIKSVVEAFSKLTLQQFINPTNRLHPNTGLVVSGADGRDFSAGTAQSSPFIVRSNLLEDDLVESEQVRVLIPTDASPTQEQVAASGLTLRVTPSTFQWEGNLELDSQGLLWAQGKFRQQLQISGHKLVIPASVSIQVDHDDLLSHLVVRESTCVIHVLPAVGAGIAVFRVVSKGNLAKPEFLGANAFSADTAHEEEGSDKPFTHTLSDGVREFVVVVWTSSPDEIPLLEGKAMASLKSRTQLFANRITPEGLQVIEVEGHEFELRAPEPKSLVQSPIVAAIDCRLVSVDLPSEDTVASIRGQLESTFAFNLDNSDWLDANFHIFLPADQENIPVEGISRNSSKTSFLMHPQAQPHWDSLADEEVPQELINSVEVSRFKEALIALHLQDSMSRSGRDAGDALDWASRTSWRSLWQDRRELLDEYLNSYAGMVSKARDISSAIGLFWASYPFSASVWTTQGTLQCNAVMLSPLHPLRLAWLASVEATLWEAESASGLAGTIEGWNLPLLGPRQTKSGRMVAIPTDSGEGQVFLGWSTLVAASVDGEEPLIAPHKIGSLTAPGSAASGLNATAATSALRSYRRMHPHVSTLTVDLAAATMTARLEEVDKAVLTQLEDWASEKGGYFRGGARVLDSLNRAGKIPAFDVARLSKKSVGMPIQWSRYRPALDSQTCNIRLLQDSGVRLEINRGPNLNLGVLPRIPLRRFEATVTPAGDSKVAFSRPAVDKRAGSWGAYLTAIREVEDAQSYPQITSRLSKSALVDDRADWTVSGESLLSPSAMAAMVQANGTGSQMLWEWRPPFLEVLDGVPELERRPFVSVARVPQGFKSRLGMLLSRVTGAEQNDSAVNRLLDRLGSRGVGLSSLLAMGGTHSAGALGFYLLFALTEFAEGAEGTERIVLPIDACDTFLKAMAGVTSHAETTRRADLLIITLRKNSVSMVPVEIKFYGMDSTAEGGTLPKLGDSRLKEAIEQLTSTTSLLKKVRERGDELRGQHKTSDLALWANSLAALIEAGIRLKPAGSKTTPDLPELLNRVANGELPLEVGAPVVTYFDHDAFTQEGGEFAVEKATLRIDGAEMPFGVLASNSRGAFKAIESPSSALAQAWSELVDWATGGEPITVGSPTPETKVSDGSAPTLDQDSPGTSPAPEKESSDEPHVSALTPPSSSHLNPNPKSDNESDGQETPAITASEGIRFPVGDLLESVKSSEAYFWPSNTALNQMNIGVVGDLGTGKTQLLRALIRQLRKGGATRQSTPISMLVFDYKRDFQSEDFLDDVGGRLLKPQAIPLNIFALNGEYSPLAAYQRASNFCDILSKIYANIGPVQKDRLITTITSLFKELGGTAPTLAEVRDAYMESGKPDAVTGILNTFVLGEIFSDDRSSLRSFEELIHDRVLVLGLSELGNDQASKNALVALFLNFYYDYMRHLPKWPFEGTNPQLRRLNSYMLVDEATNIMGYDFSVLMDLMLQGREFGCGIILASQYLSHFKTSQTNYGEPLRTWFIHKVPNVSSKQLELLGIAGASDTAATRISTLQVHHAYYSSLGFDGRFIRGIPYYELVAQEPSAPF